MFCLVPIEKYLMQFTKKATLEESNKINCELSEYPFNLTKFY